MDGVEELIVIARSSSRDTDALYEQLRRDFPETIFLQQDDSLKGQDFKPLLERAVTASENDYVILAADDCVVIDDIDVTRALTLLKQRDAYAFYFNLGANIAYVPKAGAHSSSQSYKKDAETISWKFGESAGVWSQSAMIDMTLFKKTNLLQELKNLRFTGPPSLVNALQALHHKKVRNQTATSANSKPSQQQLMSNRGLAPLRAQVITLPFNSTRRRPQHELAYDFSLSNCAHMFSMGFKIDTDELYHLDTATVSVSLFPHFVLRHKNPDYQHKHIVVVIPSYKNKDWYQKNLDSIFMQDYDNFDVIYIDDRSPDGTGNLVEKYIQEKGKNNVRLIKNTERCLALKNIYNAVHACDDDDIIVCLDGDDWLSGPHVLSLVNDLYQDPQLWLTYGQYAPDAGNGIAKSLRGCCNEIPASVVEKNDFRAFNWVSSHLRTFYAGLFKQIKKEDLQYEGKFFAMTWDLAFMFPMLEMARHNHFMFVPAVLYIYNTANSINDCKVSLSLQEGLEKIIRARSRYGTIDDYHSRTLMGK
ncbi:MAG: glycosyltransferase family 2 protein [Candidatus Dependentiae bacterium]|nr:glycosyltransferase family 2 protein [Candidatus Dependentiae bacterium]